MASLNCHTQAGHTESDDVTAKDSFLKNLDLMAMTFSHLQLEVKNDMKCHVSQIVNDKIYKKYRQCLFNAAMTCKDFLDVALDALWEELDSLVPLLKVLPALQVEDNEYVLSENVSQADWDRLQYYSRKVKVFKVKLYHDSDNPRVNPSTYFRIAQLQSSALFPSLRHVHYNLEADIFDTWNRTQTISPIFFFLSPLLDSLELFDFSGLENTIVGPFFATLSFQAVTLPSLALSRIVLRNGKMSADIFKKSIVHFKQLRSLELSDAVFMSDFVLWEVIGTLPSLINLTLKATNPASHPAHAPENSNSRSGAPKYFDVLERLCVAGSFFFIQHLLGFINSPCLNSIEVSLVISPSLQHDDHESEDLFTPSMAIVASKWSQSLNNLVIESTTRGGGLTHFHAISKCLMLLTVLHEMQNFCLMGWWMENMDDDVKRLVKAWPKLRMLRFPRSPTFISLLTLRIIAENCPELNSLWIRLDTSTIPPFDISSKSLRHNLDLINMQGVHPSTAITLECQIQLARHLDSIFPSLYDIESSESPDGDEFWSSVYNLVKRYRDTRGSLTSTGMSGSLTQIFPGPSKLETSS